MERILRTIEYNNINYKRNHMPERLIFNVETTIDNFVSNLDTLFANTDGFLKIQWNIWKRKYDNGTNVKNAYLSCDIPFVRLDLGILENRIIINFKKKYVDRFYINYTFNNKLERISLRELISLSKLNGNYSKKHYHDICNLGEFNNDKETTLYLINYNNGSKEMDLIISYKLQ